LGLDFGGVNTAGVFFAEELSAEGKATGRFFVYRTYHEGGKTAAEHTIELLKGEPMIPTVVGGSRSEGQWRDEFGAGGLPVREPVVSDVEVGITRVYGFHKKHKIIVFEDLLEYKEQKNSYSRALDENDNPTSEIEDKASFHYMDAERYIVSYLADVVGNRELGGIGVWV
jgi:hypothetical protein